MNTLRKLQKPNQSTPYVTYILLPHSVIFSFATSVVTLDDIIRFTNCMALAQHMPQLVPYCVPCAACAFTFLFILCHVALN